MITVGIDIGKGKHAVAIVNESGKQLSKPCFYDNNRAGAEALLKALAKFAQPAETHVGMESTGSYWRPFHDFLVKAGCRVDVINPIVTSASMAGDIRGRKTDKQDAVKIAGVMLSIDHVSRRPDGVAERRLKVLTRQRSFSVRTCTSAKIHLKSQLAEGFPEFEAVVGDVFSKMSLALLKQYPTAAKLARAHRPAVAKIVAENTRGKDADAEADLLVAAAKSSLCAECDIFEELGEAVVSTIGIIEDCGAKVKEMDELIKAAETPPAAKLFMQFNGAGKTLPMVVAAEFGGLERFAVDPRTGSTKDMWKRMLAFAGADPRKRESGQWHGIDKMSKRGSGQLRTALYQMAFTVSQREPYFKAIYENEKNNKHKHHSVALFRVAAKMLEVVCALYRSGRQFTPEKPESKQHPKVINNLAAPL